MTTDHKASKVKYEEFCRKVMKVKKMQAKGIKPVEHPVSYWLQK